MAIANNLIFSTCQRATEGRSGLKFWTQRAPTRGATVYLVWVVTVLSSVCVCVCVCVCARARVRVEVPGMVGELKAK